MATPDRGAVVNVDGSGAVTVALWGPDLLPGRGLVTRGGGPLVVTWMVRPDSVRLVATVVGNLRWGDPDFPVTVLD